MKRLLLFLFFINLSWAYAGTQQKEKDSKSSLTSKSDTNAETTRLPNIRFSISEAWIEPYAFFDSKKIMVAGILKELYEGIARIMKLSFEYVYLSRNRIDSAVTKQGFDVRCFVNENWVSNVSDYQWTSVLFHIRNSVVWRPGTLALHTISDLENKTIGTVAGYSYKKIGDLFAKGKIKRADVAAEAINIGLLAKGRIDYAIVEKITFDWYVKNHKLESLKNVGSLQIEDIPIKCGILKNSKVKFKEFEMALKELRREGFFKQLTINYGLK